MLRPESINRMENLESRLRCAVEHAEDAVESFKRRYRVDDERTHQEDQEIAENLQLVEELAIQNFTETIHEAFDKVREVLA